MKNMDSILSKKAYIIQDLIKLSKIVIKCMKLKKELH